MANEGKAEKRRENSNTEILKTGEQPFRPSLAASLIIVGYLIISMAAAIFYLDQKLHVTMLTAFGVAVLVLTIEKCPYSKVEEAILEGSKLAVPTILILYSIGCLMGAWIASGTVPMIIYWGLKLINPSIFLVTACLACVITSLATGSSWSTIGTVGVALIGVGMGLEINPAMTAGAIVSGAAFGDKMSPLSDTTNVAPAVAEGDLFDHIKAMVYTAGPGIVIALVAFFVLGMKHGGSADTETVSAILAALESQFHLNIITLIPPVLVIALAVMKKPALPTLLISGIVAAAIAIFMQGETLPSIANIMENGYVSETGFADIDSLLSRGGLFSMNYTSSLTIIVMVYGSLLEKLGVLEVVLEKLKVLTRTVGSLVCTTVVTAILVNLITASQYMSIVLPGRMFVSEYKKKDMLPQTLSRTLEDSGTVTSLLIPWNLCGSFASTTLGVSCIAYLPFSVFNWIVPIIAIIYGFTGKFQWKTGEIPSRKTYRPIEKSE
ncbi:Na+/H+ antiporter NhaC [Clostridium sp. M62/1]|uniref:Na+/H+ antiporter NhaC n=1 Tax=Clostridium sp. M62/1 TaxID=411486 RepID=UPI0001973464|nr:Na+/H+ antiporter NhaC [Clostridium sp. M62/1]EFE14606.1 Na+/H+ antiporter NhaC [Clostridium sp. M62/1]UEB77924.1 Na+/H+ antiporter NhaC [Clostridium sp. M62/1]